MPVLIPLCIVFPQILWEEVILFLLTENQFIFQIYKMFVVCAGL